MSAPAKTTQRPYHHGDLRKALIDAALSTIRERGVASLTVRGVGDRLGVSRTALYRHFQDKSALLAAVALDGFQTFRKALQAAVDSARQQGLDPLQEMAVAYVQFAAANPSHYQVMFGSMKCPGAGAELNEELNSEASGAFLVLVNTIREQQVAGAIAGADPTEEALVLWSLVHGVATLGMGGQLRLESARLPDFTRRACHTLHRGLRKTET